MTPIFRKILLRRDLVRELVIKDLKLRYGRPALGILWAFLTPLLTVVVFYIVFSLIFKIQIEEAPFFLYLMTAIFPWSFFQSCLMSSTSSLLENKNLIRESIFPHYCIPISIALANTINFIPSLFIMIIISAIVKKGLPVFIVLLPAILLIHLSMIIGLAIIFSVLYVRWRDLKYLLEAVLLFLFYLTPSFYSISMVKDAFPDFLSKLYMYNPLVEIINLYRIVLLKGFYQGLHKEVGLFVLIGVPLLFALAVLLFSVYIYKIKRKNLNDYL